jgi:hypothetical protein
MASDFFIIKIQKGEESPSYATLEPGILSPTEEHAARIQSLEEATVLYGAVKERLLANGNRVSRALEDLEPHEGVRQKMTYIDLLGVSYATMRSSSVVEE